MTNQLSKIRSSEQTTTLISSILENEINPMQLVLVENDLTVAKAMNQGTQLSKLAKMDKKTCIKVVMGLIIRQSQLYNLKKQITDMQAAILATDLIEVFGYETLEDIVMMFKLARQGKFDSMYGKFDHETIMNNWIPGYLEIKAIERENEHRKRKNPVSKTVVSEDAAKKIDKIISKLGGAKQQRNYNRHFDKDVRIYCRSWNLEKLYKKLKIAEDKGYIESIKLLKITIENKEKINKLQTENGHK